MPRVRAPLSAARGTRLSLLLAGILLLGACGQKGPLYLPSGEAAAQRATLPQVLSPMPAASSNSRPGAPAPATP